MSAAIDQAVGSLASPLRAGEEPAATTLLELVEAVSDASDSESEVVATVVHMLRSGRVRLTGCFRNSPHDVLRF